MYIHCTFNSLNTGDTVILSCTGYHQGDALAGIGFASVLQPVISRIKQDVPGLKANAWIQDDGNIGGNREDLLAAVSILEQDGPPRGLHIRRDKSKVFCPSHHQDDDFPLGPDIERVRAEGFRVLGSPVGSAAFSQSFLEAKVDSLETLLENLLLLKDVHSELVLLRSCFSLPKISFLTRTVPPHIGLPVFQRFDRAVRATVESIVGVPFSDTQWTQASLPVSKSGLGLRRAEDHSPAAYLASISDTAAVVREITNSPDPAEGDPDSDAVSPSSHFSIALRLFNSKVAEPFSPEAIGQSRQKVLSHEVDLCSLQQLAVALPGDRDQARINSLCLQRAGDWLNTVPNKALGLHLRDSEAIIAIKYRLGIPVFLVSGPCVACGRHSDALGDHSLGCAQQGERLSRHHALRDALYQSAQQAVLSPTREERYLLTQAGREDERPGDILIPSWTSGMDTACDVTVISPLQALTVTKAAREAGSALDTRYRAKMSKYFDACREQGIHFLPLPVETLGAWHPLAIKAIEKLGRQLGRATGREGEETVRHLFQRLSVLLMKGNAALILGRIPAYAPQEVDGDRDTEAN